MDAPSERSAAHPDQVPSETLQDSRGQRQASLSKSHSNYTLGNSGSWPHLQLCLDLDGGRERGS